MSPNLYDLLDVDPTATSDEIRAAWKAAIAELDPTDRRFRAFSDAAGVLLDEEKRAAYDAELAAAAAAEEAAQAEADAAAAASADADADDETAATTLAAPETESDDATDAPTATPVPKPTVAEPAPTRAGREPSVALLVTSVVVAMLSIALLLWVFSLPGGPGEPSPQERADAAAEESSEAASAEQAAEEIIEPVLSYDYRSIDEGLAESTAVMTPEYADQHAALIEELRDAVVDQKTVVQAVVEGTALTRISEDGAIAEVVVFVDQDVRKAKEEPVVLRMWVTATLVRDGDEWLLDALCTEGDCD